MNFDSYYNEPDDPPISPESDEIGAILECAGVADDVIERVARIVDDLARKLADERERECVACAKRAAEREAESEKLAAQWERENYVSLLCPHRKQFIDCNVCLAADDLAYDAQRERRIR